MQVPAGAGGVSGRERAHGRVPRRHPRDRGRKGRVSRRTTRRRNRCSRSERASACRRGACRPAVSGTAGTGRSSRAPRNARAPVWFPQTEKGVTLFTKPSARDVSWEPIVDRRRGHHRRLRATAPRFITRTTCLYPSSLNPAASAPVPSPLTPCARPPTRPRRSPSAPSAARRHRAPRPLRLPPILSRALPSHRLSRSSRRTSPRRASRTRRTRPASCRCSSLCTARSPRARAGTTAGATTTGARASRRLSAPTPRRRRRRRRRR